MVVKVEEAPGEDKCTFDTYHDGKNTGYIDLTIETKTPLYIRDTLTEDEMQKKKK